MNEIFERYRDLILDDYQHIPNHYDFFRAYLDENLNAMQKEIEDFIAGKVENSPTIEPATKIHLR